jgi:predicted RNA-binding protein with TRAM domain
MPTVPDAPIIGTVTGGDRQVTVTFTAPSNTGGAVITGYTVTSSPGDITATGAGSPITVERLTNGTAYTFTVTAKNSAGTGAASEASNVVTPQSQEATPQRHS